MRTIEIKVFKYEELDEEAKERARDWYREGLLMDTWWHEAVIEDFLAIAKILGIDTDVKQVEFTGFWNQGDGASYTGHYTYRPEAVEEIKSYAPQDEELHRIAEELEKHQRVQQEGELLCANLTRFSHHYSHPFTVTYDVYLRDEEGEESNASADTEEGVKKALVDLANWLYRQLEKEWEYRNSDEAVEEAIIANEYEFTEDGERFTG